MFPRSLYTNNNCHHEVSIRNSSLNHVYPCHHQPNLRHFFRLLNRNKKTETAETVEVSKSKRRGLLGNLGLKKKSKEQAKKEEEKPEEHVEEHAEETAPEPVEETKPLEPEEEDARELEAAKEEEPVEEPVEDPAPVEELKEEINEIIEEREQPVMECATPKEATSTGFLCGCL